MKPAPWRVAAVLVTVALGLATATARAADSAGNYAIWGAGAHSCNQFLHGTADASGAQAYKPYVMGYLTAANALLADTYNAVGTMKLGDAWRWLHDYCDKHKMESFERALAGLVASQHDARQRTERGGGSWGRAEPPPAPAAGQ